MRSAEKLTSSFAYHGEGPFWDWRGQRLLCMDVFAGTVVAVDSVGNLQYYSVPTKVTTVVRRRTASGFVIATETGLLLADDALSELTPLAEVIDDPTLRTNDGSCDPFGAFIIGTMAYNEEPGRGAVYRVTPDGEVTEILAPVSISNGVQFSADGTRVFYIDTPTRRVDVFDIDPQTGAWSNRRTHINIDGANMDGAAGFPDGMAIDEDDGVWIALWGGGAVHHYDKNGRFVEAITVPGVSQVSACTFGGTERDLLYITTSRYGMRAEEEPAAGAVFVTETSVRGAEVAEFAG